MNKSLIMKSAFIIGSLFAVLTAVTVHAGEKSTANPAATVSAGKPYVYKHSAGQPRQMEIYFPPNHDPATSKVPGVILFHGGGWTGGSLSQFRTACHYLASRGLVCATAEYQMLSKGKSSKLAKGETRKRVCIVDAKSAIRWFKQNADKLGIDTNRIITGGGSAGGHISALATLNPGLKDPADEADFDTSVVAYLWFNPAFSPDDAQDEEVNVLRFLKPDMAPGIAFFGTKDNWKKGWDAAHQQLKTLGNSTTELWLAEGQGHGFFNKDPWQTITLIAADRFLVQQGLLSGEPTLVAPSTGEELIASDTALVSKK